MSGSSPVGIAANGTMTDWLTRSLCGRGLFVRTFGHLHLLPYTPWLHRVLLHGFFATMGVLTSARSHPPTIPVSLGSFPFQGRYALVGLGH